MALPTVWAQVHRLLVCLCWYSVTYSSLARPKHATGKAAVLPWIFMRTLASSLEQKFLTFLGSPCGESNASYKYFPQKNSNIYIAFCI